MPVGLTLKTQNFAHTVLLCFHYKQVFPWGGGGVDIEAIYSLCLILEIML